MSTRNNVTKILLPTPTEKQKILLKETHRHVGYGGARGGGKSMGVRMKSTILASAYPGIREMIVRKTYPELLANHILPMMEMLHCGNNNGFCRYNEAKKMMIFANGSYIMFRYCDSEKDADRYQGTEVDVLFLDEATMLTETQIKKLNTCVRGINHYPKRTYYTCNPGGVSHGYIKRLFIDKKFKDREKPEDYAFIQSLVTDNEPLMKSQPEYVAELESLPPALKKAWLEGRWDVFEGAYFEEFRETPDAEKIAAAGLTEEEALMQRRWTHVIKPFDIPPDWKILRGYDWGFGKPFSCAWYALSPEGNGPMNGVLYRILELYGCTSTPNEGVKWTNKKQFKEIARIENEHPWLKGKRILGIADPSIWDGSHDANGVSPAEEAEKSGLWFEKGNNERIPGWMQVRERMKFDENGYAKLYFFDNCKAIIRTMPLMMYDEHIVEDLDSDLEDHACLVGDTQVLTDKGYKRFKELDREGYVISHDGQKHRYKDCGITRHKAEVFEVELEDGTKFRGTSDHPIMLSDGTWCPIFKLLGKDVKTWKS